VAPGFHLSPSALAAAARERRAEGARSPHTALPFARVQTALLGCGNWVATGPDDGGEAANNEAGGPELTEDYFCKETSHIQGPKTGKILTCLCVTALRRWARQRPKAYYRRLTNEVFSSILWESDMAYCSVCKGEHRPHASRGVAAPSRNRRSRERETYISGGYEKYADDGSTVHRDIAAQKIGRPLRPEEVVHHIDGNKLNNDPSNLRVCKNQAEHEAIHRRQGDID